MIRGLIPFIFCLTIVLAIGCSEDDTVTWPEKDLSMILEGDPIDIVYITSGDSVSENYSDTFSVRWGDLVWDVRYYMYEDAWMDNEKAVTEELVAGDDGTITVIITDCPTGHTWKMFYSEPADLHLTGIDSVNTTATLYDVTYRYKIHRPGKGYIGFLEIPPRGYGAREKGIGVMYTCGVIETLRVDIDSITWFYEDPEYGTSLDVSLEGKTNAHGLFIETYGDGCIGISEIPLDNEGVFCKKYGLSFCYGGKDYLKTNSRLFVIGTVGLPKVINLQNPLNSSGR